MTEPDVQDRLQRMLRARADQVCTQLSGARLRAEATTQQIGSAMHESGEPTGSGDAHPSKREDRTMSIDGRQHGTDHPTGDDITLIDSTLVDSTPARRHGRRLAVASGAALAAAAAAVVALVVAPGHRPATGGAPAASRPAAATHHTGATGGSYTYVHATFGDGTTSFQDVWIPADPATGVWQLIRKDDQGIVSQRAACAAFAFFQVPNVQRRNADGSSTTLNRGGIPPCDTSAGWNGPYRPPFAESLPTDPTALLAALRAASGGTDAETFALGSGFVASGWVPEDIASNVLAALRLIPGVTERQGVANGAGASGTALTYTGRIKPAVPETWGVIVSASGDVIGSTFAYSGRPTEVDGITRTTVGSIGATR